MSQIIKRFLKISLIAALVPMTLFAAQQPNPRNANTNRNQSVSPDTISDAAIRRSATSVIARSAKNNMRQARSVVVARPGANMTRGANIRAVRTAVSGGTKSRSAAKTTMVRSGVSQKVGGTATLSRAAQSRATAVFNDISKIGGGYMGCRDAYATCMDQFCANASDTYRRCFCSDKFKDYRDMSDRLDTVLQMLVEFQDNNLNAVDKTAAEVDAMYSASAGEAAIKRDTSASQQLLNSIGDVLSGKSAATTKNNLNSLGVLDLGGFGIDDTDVWGGSSSVFNTQSGVDLTKLEGKTLYDNAAKQCADITRESCGGDTMFNLAKSAYSIMITQDCNAYEKNMNAKKASVQDTVRKAETMLRDARLEEYRAHNSADVNDCLGRVESAMRQSTACGENYEKCMDYTGQYINQSTGEPIYSQALFGLNSLIVLNGASDVLGANPDFNKWLDGKRMFATTALDSCRNIADTVWTEFKRVALIQIAQAQDEKIESVKSECVDIIKDCYDTNTGALNNLAGETGSSVRSIAVGTTRDFCKDKVFACAALYGDVDGCKYDDKTKKLENNNGKKCGLQSLLAFVDTVDAVKMSKGCEESLREYAQELCKSADSAHKWPWGCRLRLKGESYDDTTDNTLFKILRNRAENFCNADNIESFADNNEKIGDILNQQVAVENIVQEISEALDGMFAEECENVDGIWLATENAIAKEFSQSIVQSGAKNMNAFVANVFGGNKSYANNSEGWGICAENTAMTQCLAQSGDKKTNATWDQRTLTCTFSEQWYNDRCASIGGYYTGTLCYVPKE